MPQRDLSAAGSVCFMSDSGEQIEPTDANLGPEPEYGRDGQDLRDGQDGRPGQDDQDAQLTQDDQDADSQARTPLERSERAIDEAKEAAAHYHATDRESVMAGDGQSAERDAELDDMEEHEPAPQGPDSQAPAS